MIRQHVIDKFKQQYEKYEKEGPITDEIIDKLLKPLTKEELMLVAQYLEGSMTKQGVDFIPIGKAKH